MLKVTGIWARETANGYELRYASAKLRRMWEHVATATGEAWRLMEGNWHDLAEAMHETGVKECDRNIVPDDEHGWFWIPDDCWEQVGVGGFDGVNVPSAMQQERVGQMAGALKRVDSFVGWTDDGKGGFTIGQEPVDVPEPAKEPVAEPEPVTVEIPAVEPDSVESHGTVVATSDTVREITIPDGVKVRDVPELAGYARRRAFADNMGRKLGYVCWGEAGITLAFRSRYEQGSDVEFENAMRAFAATLDKDTVAPVSKSDTPKVKPVDGRSRDERIKELQDGLNASILALQDSDKWLAYLDFMRKFHEYSFKNQLLIAVQLGPNASLIAGYRQWQERGRQVRKGEKAALIMAPFTYAVKDTDGKPILDDDGRKIHRTYFRFVPVFDISQTDSIDAKNNAAESVLFASVSKADETRVYERVESWLKHEGWTVKVDDSLGPQLHGFTRASEKLIAVNGKDGDGMRACTLVHEAAHAVLQTRLDDPAHKDYKGHRGLAETEAESVAYVVCGLLGLDTSESSITYIGGWSEFSAETLGKAADNVSKAVNLIMDGVEVRAADKLAKAA